MDALIIAPCNFPSWKIQPTEYGLRMVTAGRVSCNCAARAARGAPDAGTRNLSLHALDGIFIAHAKRIYVRDRASGPLFSDLL